MVDPEEEEDPTEVGTALVHHPRSLEFYPVAEEETAFVHHPRSSEYWLHVQVQVVMSFASLLNHLKDCKRLQRTKVVLQNPQQNSGFDRRKYAFA